MEIGRLGALRRQIARLFHGSDYGLLAESLLKILYANGYTREEIDSVRDSMVVTVGFGLFRKWHLIPQEERERLRQRRCHAAALAKKPKRVQTRAPRKRESMEEFRSRYRVGRQAKAPTPRRELLHCEKCGVHIGERAEGEPMLCHKLACREAA